mgnify:CR=1 FL=1
MSTPIRSDRRTATLTEPNRAYYIMLGVAGLVVAGMVFSFISVLTQGHHLTGLNNWGTDGGVPWGLDIGAFSWWSAMGVGGIALSSIIRVFRMDEYKPYARIGELLTPLAFGVGFLHIVFDLGQPFRVLNTLLYLPLESPIAWDVILLAGLGTISFVYLLASLREDIYDLSERGALPDMLSPVYDVLLTGYEPTDEGGRDLTWWLAALVLAFIPIVGGGVVPLLWGPLGVNINWFGAIQGPSFLAASMATGAAAMLFIAGILRYAYGLEDVFTDRTLRIFGALTGGFTFTYLLGTFYEIQTGTFAADLADPNVSSLIFGGPLAPLLVLAIAAIAIPTAYLTIQHALGQFSLLGTLVITGIMLVGVLHMETWLIVGGLMYPDLLYPVGEYTPSIYEWLNLMGTTALVALVMLVFAKTLPVVSVDAGGADQ